MTHALNRTPYQSTVEQGLMGLATARFFAQLRLSLPKKNRALMEGNVFFIGGKGAIW